MTYHGKSPVTIIVDLSKQYNQPIVPKVIIMQPAKKVIELIFRKYLPPVFAFDSNNDGNLNSLIDTSNKTLFTVSDNLIYTYRDKYLNHWLTIPRSFIINDKTYYPVVGDEYILSDGTKYSFTTKEVITAMALSYFEKFIDENYGIKKELSYLIFFDEGCEYFTEFKRFKSKTHKKIKAYISNN